MKTPTPFFKRLPECRVLTVHKDHHIVLRVTSNQDMPSITNWVFDRIEGEHEDTSVCAKSHDLALALCGNLKLADLNFLAFAKNSEKDLPKDGTMMIVPESIHYTDESGISRTFVPLLQPQR